jgi:hypothetical protein
MRHESKQVLQDPIKAPRVIVLLILGHTEGLAWSELTAKLDDLTPNALADALRCSTMKASSCWMTAGFRRRHARGVWTCSR